MLCISRFHDLKYQILAAFKCGTCSPGLAISRCATILGSGLVTYSLNYSCPSASICGHTGIVLYSIGFVNSVVFPPLGLGHRYITFLGCTEVSFVCLFSSSACTVCTVRLHTAIGVTSSIRYKWIENGKSWWKVCKYFVLFDSRDRRRGVYHVVDVATLRFPCTSFGQKISWDPYGRSPPCCFPFAFEADLIGSSIQRVHATPCLETLE